MSLTLRQQFGGHGRQPSDTAIADLLPPQQARSFTQQPACPPGPPLNADALCGPTFNIPARPPPAGGAAPAAPPSAPAGSPRLAGLGGGDSLLLPLTEPDGEDDDCGDAEAGGGRPWFAQWAFWLPALSCSFGVALAFAGVTSLTVSPEKASGLATSPPGIFIVICLGQKLLQLPAAHCDVPSHCLLRPHHTRLP